MMLVCRIAVNELSRRVHAATIIRSIVLVTVIGSNHACATIVLITRCMVN